MTAKATKSKTKTRDRTHAKEGKRSDKADHRDHSDKRWVRGVKTVSTFPPEDTFNKDASTIARTMASKKVSPKGIGSGIKMVQFFINRAGKNLPAEQKKELEKAKRLLQDKLARQKEKAHK